MFPCRRFPVRKIARLARANRLPRTTRDKSQPGRGQPRGRFAAQRDKEESRRSEKAPAPAGRPRLKTKHSIAWPDSDALVSFQLQHVAETAHGVNEFAVEIAVDLAAQPRNQYINHIRLRIEIVIP